MKFIGLNNESAEAACADVLDKALSKLPVIFKTAGSNAILGLVRKHVNNKYPGSKHWSPSKIVLGQASAGEAAIDINVAGASRAWHDVDIRPKRAKMLAIPFRRGVVLKDEKNTFVMQTGGKAFIAKNDMSGLTFLAVLKNHVHQRKDSSLMPTDKQVAEAAWNATTKLI